MSPKCPWMNRFGKCGLYIQWTYYSASKRMLNCVEQRLTQKGQLFYEARVFCCCCFFFFLEGIKFHFYKMKKFWRLVIQQYKNT